MGCGVQCVVFRVYGVSPGRPGCRVYGVLPGRPRTPWHTRTPLLTQRPKNWIRMPGLGFGFRVYKRVQKRDWGLKQFRLYKRGVGGGVRTGQETQQGTERAVGPRVYQRVWTYKTVSSVWFISGHEIRGFRVLGSEPGRRRTRRRKGRRGRARMSPRGI